MAAINTNRRGRRTISDINMVPFIDVMLVLLIIFMVTAPLLSPSVIDVPTVGKASSAPDQVITEAMVTNPAATNTGPKVNVAQYNNRR
jgi:biopolymer transport protein TolR